MYFDPRLWRLTVGLRGPMAAGFLLGLLALAVGIARFAFLGRFLAGVFAAEPFVALLTPLLATAACILARAGLEHARAMMAHRTTATIQNALRGTLFDKIVRLGPAWFGAERTGGVMLSLTDGVEQLQTFFGQYLPQVAVAACAPVLIFAFIAWWDLPVAAVMLGAALFTLVLPGAVHSRTAAASLAQQRAFKAFGAAFLDAVQGLPTLKAFGQSSAYGAQLAVRARALSDSTLGVLALSVLTRGITDLGCALGAAGALALGAWRVQQGEMSLTALLIVLMAGTEIFRPLRDLRTVLHQGMAGQSAAAGIHALLEAPETAPTLVTPPAPRARACPRASTRGPMRAEHRVRAAPAISFDRVTFAYPGGRGPAHRDLSFSIAPGERIGIVGPSGAGKSSIVQLLLRLHDPQSGSVRIDGEDLRGLDPTAVQEDIALVAQDAMLFHGSVAENLRLGRPGATDAEMIAAAAAANAHDFIGALPQGYATLLGERGVTLSGGQRQRIAIARALLRDAPILVLDEALSSVDAENEAVIQQALERLMAGRTTLILAHRLSSVIGADRILVLDQGRVAESGSHAELIARDGPYRRLMAPQLADRMAAVHAVLPRLREAAAPIDASGPPVRALAEDAAVVGWPQTIRALLGFIRPWARELAATVLCGVGRVVAFIGVGVLGALVLAAVKSGGPTRTLTIALLAAAPIAALLHWVESWLAHHMAYQLLAELRIRLFAKLDRLAPAWLLRRRSGDLVALATQDIETVEYFYAHTVAPAFVAVLVPVAVLGALAWLAWPLALALLPFLAWAGAAPVLGRRRIDTLASAARGAGGELAAHAAETIQGLTDLIVLGAIGRRRAAFVALGAGHQAMRRRLMGDLSRQTAAQEIATGLGGLAVAAVGAPLVAQGWLAAGMLPLAVLLGVAAFLPVSEIAQVGRQLADTIASTRRLHVVESEPEPIRDGAQPAEGSGVSFEAVQFTYPGATRPALRDLTLEVAAGATVALVGPSGAGKTTIANLLLRFWDPASGVVRLGGRDLRSLRLDGLRARIALVAQDTYLFNDTLAANVRLARPEATDAEVARAVRLAALEPFIATLPHGLATPVGERGVQLSGGQRQRVAIARAFLKDAPILILDEATSHLDTLSEQAVRTALDALMTDRTTIVIAHRLSTVRGADLIVVLHEGSVAEIGTHAALLARGGIYARLVGRQAAALDPA